MQKLYFWMNLLPNNSKRKLMITHHYSMS